MKFSVLWLFLVLSPGLVGAQSESGGEPRTSGAPDGVVGTLIPTPPELDPELNYCLNVTYQVELREHIRTHPHDNAALVRYALLLGLCELVFDGLIDEATAMKLWARESMD